MSKETSANEDVRSNVRHFCQGTQFDSSSGDTESKTLAILLNSYNRIQIAKRSNRLEVKKSFAERVGKTRHDFNMI